MPTPTSGNRWLAFGLLSVSLLGGASLEAQIVSLSNAATPLPAVATARYRLDSTNWDMAIFNEQPGPSAADFVVVDLGSQAQLSGDTFKFSLQNKVGQGLIWKLFDNSDLTGPAGGTVAWGSNFAPAITGPFTAVKSDLDGELPGQFYNGINLELRAFAADSQMHLSNVSFTGTGATVLGSIANVSAVYNNTGFSYIGSLLSTTDMSTFDWTLSGEIRGVKTSGGQESVAFNVQLVAIPEPGTYALILGAAGLVGAALRRRIAGLSSSK